MLEWNASFIKRGYNIIFAIVTLFNEICVTSFASSMSVLSNLFRSADHLGLKIHLPRPTSIEGMHFVDLVQRSLSKICCYLILDMRFEY